ncbi:MAG: phage portal protein [Gammaproteobacteria bacterium]|nr:phage portal protein [Gammaproteobacteria bacterium]
MQTFDPARVIAQRPWFERALEVVAPGAALRRMQARVEAALFSYNAAQTNRLYAPQQFGQPSESSQTVRDRIVMMWEARNLVENCPEVKEISRKFGNYLTPTEYCPSTGDREYNRIVSDYFHDWCKTADATGRNSFRKLIQVAAENRPVDGDCGFVIRRVGDGLKLQLIPATRIGNPNDQGLNSENYFEGVVVDEFGVPIAYRIFRVTREGVYFGAEDVPAANFAHYFDPFRVDQYRGVTDFHAAIQTARMLHEILKAEQAGVRFASQQAALVYSDRGTANSRNLFTPTPSTTLPSGQAQKNELSEVGIIKYLGQADRVETMPSRPSTAFTGFVEHLMHELAIAVGIPQGVLFGTQNYKGPSVRAEFAAADRVFARHQGVLTDKVLDPVKNAVLLDAIAREQIPPPALAEGETMVQALKRATRGEWRFPPKLSIDVGRDSAANLNENRQGAKSLQEIAAEQGTDAFTRLEQIAMEASFVGELAKKYNIPETSIRMVTQQLPANPAMAAALGANIAQDAVDAVNATTGKGSGAETPTSAAEGATPDAPVERVSASADLITVNFAEDSYVPNQQMADNARRALEVRASKPPSQRGMTAVGLARARDIQNKKPLSEETVRRMKAYFDRHEIDKQGETWDDQGKGWQAWHGWGGDAGAKWAAAIVERLNKQRAENSAAPAKVQFSAATEVQLAIRSPAPDANDWLTAVQQYRAELDQRSAAHVTPIVLAKTPAQLLEARKFDLPTPNSGETHDEFMTRCLADPVATAEFPNAEQRYAVCMRQHEGEFAKVGPRGGIVGSDKAPKSDTPNRNPEGEGSAKGDASGKSAEVSKEQEATLQQKADDFNAKDSNTRYGRATLGALKSVFQRGLGAFNTSHSPRVQSASQWAFARVNAFLYLLKNGRPENPKYVTDNDLLPKTHPKSSK